MAESDWSAWYNDEPPKHDTELHVSGQVAVNNETDEVTLEIDNAGTGDPNEIGKLIALRVVVTPARIGLPVTSKKQVDWAEDVGSEVERVRIYDVDGSSFEIEVKHVS